MGNGGDSMAAEFVSAADDTLQLVETLANSPDAALPQEFDFLAFKRTVATARVFSQETTYLGDIEVDALNYPAEQKIVVSRKRWLGLGFNLKATRMLIIHEYLGLAGVNDTSYQVSSKLLRKISNGGSSGELWLLKDLADSRYTNPFYGAFFETTFEAFSPVKSSARVGGLPAPIPRNAVVYFQNGKKIKETEKNENLPYCYVQIKVTSLPDSNAKLKFPIFASSEANDASGAVFLDLRKSFITPIVCKPGERQQPRAKLTVKDALDALEQNFFLVHTGTASRGNVQCLAE